MKLPMKRTYLQSEDELYGKRVARFNLPSHSTTKYLLCTEDDGRDRICVLEEKTAIWLRMPNENHGHFASALDLESVKDHK